MLVVVLCFHENAVIFEMREHLAAISHSDAMGRWAFTTFCEENCVVFGAETCVLRDFVRRMRWC